MRVLDYAIIGLLCSLIWAGMSGCGDDAGPEVITAQGGSTQEGGAEAGAGGDSSLDGLLDSAGGFAGSSETGPGGAGGASGNGGVAGVAGSQGGTAGGGPSLCNPAQKSAVWGKMVQDPLKPPRFGAQLDLAGGETWQGLTLEEAEKINCDSQDAGDVWGDGSLVRYWGDNGEVFLTIDTTTHKGSQLTLNPGYVGALEFKSRDTLHSFRIGINSSIEKDGNYNPIPWSSTGLQNMLDELSDALLATYAPAYPAAATAGTSVTGSFGNVAYVYWPLLGLVVWTPDQNATPNIVDRVDIYLVKSFAFDDSRIMLKLDQAGPLAKSKIPVLNPSAGLPCELKFGLEYQVFSTACVRITPNTEINSAEEGKLFGGLTHDAERYHFDLPGVSLDFAASGLSPAQVVSDSDRPKFGDIATELTVSSSTIGRFLNDRRNSDPVGPRDNHGFGLVNLEYARLVQTEIHKWLVSKGKPTYPLGAPQCLEPNVNPSTDEYPEGCTGFEGFLTCAPRGSVPDPLLDKISQGFDPALNGGAGYPACGYIDFDLQSGLKPTALGGAFCSDPVEDPQINDTTGVPAAGFKHCITGGLWATSLARVLHVVGHDKLEDLPPDLRDARFYFRMYFKALAKYMLVAGTANETPDGVHNAVVNSEDLHFDVAAEGVLETAAYVDRRFASATTPPVEFSATANIAEGKLLNYRFQRHLYRGESLVYGAAREVWADPIGKELSGSLTNVFGSRVLREGWQAAGGKSAFECATADPPNPGGCAGQNPPLDSLGQTLKNDDGTPLLFPYKAAFEGNDTALSLFRAANTPRIQVGNLLPAIAAAEVSVPLFSSPYSPTSAVQETWTRLLGLEVKGPTVGLTLPTDAQNDKFLQCYRSPFSGSTLSGSLAWDWAMPDAGAGDVKLLAIESGDFLGEVFVCQDPASKALLRARLHTPAEELEDWVAAHPAASTSCALILRYDSSDNTLQSMTSLSNGVRVNFAATGGKPRVRSALLFVPGL